MVQLQRHRTVLHLLVLVGIITLINLVPQRTHAAGFSASDIISDTNAARTKHGIGSVQVNAALTAAAEAKAQDMVTRQYFGHVSPTGAQPWSFMATAGYTYTTAGENLAIDFIDAADVVTAWLASPEHRANILKTNYRDIGVAVVDGTLNGQRTTIVVQFFGSHKLTVSPTPTTTPPPTAATTSKPVATASAPTRPAVIAQPARTPTSIAPVREVVTLNTAWTGRPVHHVAGATTEVIHSGNAAPTLLPIYHPEYALLIIATLGFYVTLVAVLLGVQLHHPVQPQATAAPANIA